MDSGQPALKKQEAIWILQEDHAVRQLASSVKSGRGVEHHFPHLYSQVGGVTTVAVQMAGPVAVEVVVVTVELAEVVEATELAEVVEETELAEVVEATELEVVEIW
jgi:hypothetical protein